jgi:hypothetical protein
VPSRASSTGSRSRSWSRLLSKRCVEGEPLLQGGDDLRIGAGAAGLLQVRRHAFGVEHPDDAVDLHRL